MSWLDTLSLRYRYFVYWILLYSADLAPGGSLFHCGLLGGWYMIPLYIRLGKKSSIIGLKYISYTTKTIDKMCFDSVFLDNIKDVTDGLECEDKFGNGLLVFKVLCGFLAEYSDFLKLLMFVSIVLEYHEYIVHFVSEAVLTLPSRPVQLIYILITICSEGILPERSQYKEWAKNSRSHLAWK